MTGAGGASPYAVGVADPLSEPVSAEKIRLAESYGLKNAGPAALASRAAGLYFYVACALLEKESGGRNVYGHDAGGALSGFPGLVNEGNFEVFRWLVLDKGQTSNGVGPCQITYAGPLKAGKRDGGYFREMEAAGLKPWDIHDNMLKGFQILLKHYQSHGRSWAAAGTAYNGATAYGVDLAAKIKTWQSRFQRLGK